ncbi:uncharacterized protein MELLADRAFT_70730 [Melampsora larici-populina 98AG31]|uniref:Uncharacterized protein n=1 Tax=Melampsora larici-populina (strain 98AG31 / pathotype 3-4-7) TaxID=747676 RepID=F4R628_MELLP|nr:uncharacterized protein MELLADRAFT_70730 [Melampsora larici-populina 98AG31]EGG12146.1 hypothetical protein MELLADRAFT_70730 [Melampsora larici-populina 98AG31]
MILFEESRVPTPVNIPEDVIITDVNRDMDNLVIPSSHLSLKRHHCESQHNDVILNKDDIVLPLHQTKSSENLLIPNPIST